MWFASVQIKSFSSIILVCLVFGKQNLVYLYFSLTADINQLRKKISLLADIFQLDLIDWSLTLSIAVKTKQNKNGVIIETKLTT